jgi:hypothetical protein
MHASSNQTTGNSRTGGGALRAEYTHLPWFLEFACLYMEDLLLATSDFD